MNRTVRRHQELRSIIAGNFGLDGLSSYLARGYYGCQQLLGIGAVHVEKAVDLAGGIRSIPFDGSDKENCRFLSGGDPNVAKKLCSWWSAVSSLVTRSRDRSSGGKEF